MSIRNVFDEISSFENIVKAEHDVKLGSRYNRDELLFWKNYEDNIHFISQSLKNLDFPPDVYRSFYIYEPKLRKIVCSDYVTKIIQRAVYNVLNPIVCKGFIRVCIVLKNLWRNIKCKVLPERSVLLCQYNRGSEKEILSDDRIEEASTYAQVYLLIFIIGSILLSYYAGCPFLYGAFEFASSLGTVGLSIGVTSMELSNTCLLIEIAGMILGRLEIFVLFKMFDRK